jgi:ubiquinone/menaquinone biosynthesis C-methylase UbiE
MLDLKKILVDVKLGKALDVGTRLGEFAQRMAEALPEGMEIIGIDCDAAVVAETSKIFQGTGLTFVCMDGASMDYPDETFQLVAISNTLPFGGLR